MSFLRQDDLPSVLRGLEHRIAATELRNGASFFTSSTFTPTWTQGVSITFTTTYAKKITVGDLIFVHLSLAATSAGTASSAITVGGLPTASASEAIGGSFVYNDGSTVFAGGVIGAGTTSARMYADQATTSLGLAASPYNVTVASGHDLRMTLMYETG